MPASAAPGTTSLEEDPLLAADQVGDPVADLASCSAGVRPSGLACPPGADLVLQAGHAHLEELVEVLAEDGQELGPLEQRDRSGRRPGRAPGR
jgi:hypothetical protein